MANGRFALIILCEIGSASKERKQLNMVTVSGLGYQPVDLDPDKEKGESHAHGAGKTSLKTDYTLKST